MRLGKPLAVGIAEDVEVEERAAGSLVVTEEAGVPVSGGSAEASGADETRRERVLTGR
ncbi:hypothetical protein [Streptomyces sp. NPDC007100]|uniref:hypothetical protein n=1 Tax=unclassified Streptomyces TaxID=2593676 RepID=UPI003410F9A1